MSNSSTAVSENVHGSQAKSGASSSAASMQARALASFLEVVPDGVRWFAESQSKSRVSPLTGLPLPGLIETDVADMPLVFTRGKAAQAKWAQKPINARGAFLTRFESLMWKFQAQILDVIQWETGKPRKQAFEELLDVSQNVGFVVGKGPGILRPTRTAGAMPVLSRATIAHRPWGVIGVIAPWNYPFTLSFSDACAALLAGNTAVVKPASQTPLSAVLVWALLHRAGLPEDVFQVVIGPGTTIGEAVAQHGDYVMFTGSTKVGVHLAELSASRLVGFSGELGGKNPSIIFPDADLQKWARTAKRECFSSSGQLCVSIERMYIHEDIWPEAVARLVNEVETLRPGRDFTWATDYGPLVDVMQFDKVSAQVSDAVEKGATVLTGGVPMPALGPTGFAPTLLTGVTEEMTLHSEETFGAAVALYRWRDEEDVIARANDSTYGLNGSVWSADVARAHRVASRLQVGSVSINEAYGATWGAVTAPIGGFKNSGLGRRHGREGILKYTESQTVTVGPPSLDPWFGMGAESWAKVERAVIRGRNQIWRLVG